MLLAPADQLWPEGAWGKGQMWTRGLRECWEKVPSWTLVLEHGLQPSIGTPHPRGTFLTRPRAHLPRFSQPSSRMGKEMVSPSAGKKGQY